jgi:hypothetical protein
MQAYNRMRRITEDLPKMLFLMAMLPLISAKNAKDMLLYKNKKCSSW